MNNDPFSLAEQVGKLLQAKKLMLTTAESCTGGQVAEIITAIAGSSAWFDRGFVTYSNTAKQEMLGVSANTLATHGAVSQQTAREMAEGALIHSHADVSLSTTGIAGPNGGTPDKPVGTVWFGWTGKNLVTKTRLHVFQGDRQSIREQASVFVLQNLLEYLSVS